MTRLTDGRHGVMVDSGTVGNLIGEYTAYDMVQRIRGAGLTTRWSLPAGDRNPYVFDRSQPLNISGVGPGSISCDRDCRLPLALNQVGLGSVPASFRAPIIPNSHLPPLLGIDTLRAYRSIIDTNTSRIYLLGSGTYDIESHLPSGTIFLQGEVVPSGHLVIPSDGYAFEIGEIPGGNNNAAAGGTVEPATFPDHEGDNIMSGDDVVTGNMFGPNDSWIHGVVPPFNPESQDSHGTDTSVALRFHGMTVQQN